VIIHGAVTAAQQSGSTGMFLFGFLWMFVFTQIHGLPYYLSFAETCDDVGGTLNILPSNIPSSKWKRRLLRLAPAIIYLVIATLSYGTWLRDEDRSIGVQLTEIIRIPSILYLMAVFVAIVGYGMMTASNCNCVVSEEIEDKVGSEESNKIGPGTALAAHFIVYGCMISISVACEAIHVKMHPTIVMVILLPVFAVCALFAMIVMEKGMGRVRLGKHQRSKQKCI